MSIESFESPESTSIIRASYDSDTEVLSVEFKRSETTTMTYDYANVPPKMWEEFSMSESKGSFFGRFIRTLYSGTRREFDERHSSR